MNKSFLSAVALGLLSCGGATAALADEPAADSRRAAVYYGDLNIQSEAGKQMLNQRLRFAARSVCPDSSARDLNTRISGKRCVKQAIGQAAADVSEQQVARAAARLGDRG